MATDKRSILLSKRARNRRKKALRANRLDEMKSLGEGMRENQGPECDEDLEVAMQPITCKNTQLLTQIDTEIEDDELVFVCRATAPDICTRFVPWNPQNPHRTDSGDLRFFTVRIPSFHETSDGYTAYTVLVRMCHDAQKLFRLERRFSDFIAFAERIESQVQRAHSAYKGQLVNSCLTGNVRSELPPKTWFRVTHTGAIEERRFKLESWMEQVLSYEGGKICRLPAIRDFLLLDLFGAQIMEEKLYQHLD
uniref:Uncharacterized protein AlNc14C212G8935 n=1 Tax=Albugo laibachii Nc14 TaxID=890382 RepID=F0WRD0_9STRA|nr:conserved hypothetical protein [Albugo laibachii Nc14]|eukprot:CCA23893.1 conserved hypothetical protein [Albugo laibachii Nc14]